MITLETTGLLFCLLGIALIAYAMLAVSSNYDIQKRVGGMLSIPLRYDIKMAFAYILTGFAFQFAGSFAPGSPAVAAFTMAGGVFLYMIFLGERSQLAESAIDDYESRKNSRGRNKVSK